jgi:hypothetical protein
MNSITPNRSFIPKANTPEGMSEFIHEEPKTGTWFLKEAAVCQS